MAALLASSAARAQSWTPVGVPGGNVRSLAMDSGDPDRVYLGTAEGVLYRSEDGGVHWTRLDPGFPCRGCSLDDIEVAPDGDVYVGYWEVHGSGGGVARSADHGASFTIAQGLHGSVRALAISPSDPDLIAAGTLDGVYLSRDGGDRWTRVSPQGHPDLRNVESLLFDRSDAQTLLAGTWHLAWKTADAGASWVGAHDGIIDDSDIMTLTSDHRDPRALFATACSGIYRSTDGGGRWAKLNGIPYSSRRTRAFAQSAEDPDLLLAGTTEGLFVSETGGDDWRRATRKDLVVNAVLALPGGRILVGTEGAGVLRSGDRGHTWVASNSGFSERFVYRILFDHTGHRVVVAEWGVGHDGGVYTAPTLGGPWVRVTEGLAGRRALSLATLGSTLVAGTDDGIYTRAADASAWTRVHVRLDDGEAHPRVTDLVALAPGTLVAATAKGILCSNDGGHSWARPTPGPERAVASLIVMPGDSPVILAAAGDGIFRSEDGGARWARVAAPLGVDVHAMALLPGNERVVLATTSGGLYRSGDGGVTWRRVGGGLPHSDLTGIAADPETGAVYVSDFTWGGIFRSQNDGSSWQRMPTDGLASDRVWTLSLDPRSGRLVVAAAAGGMHVLSPAAMNARWGSSRAAGAKPSEAGARSSD